MEVAAEQQFNPEGALYSPPDTRLSKARPPTAPRDALLGRHSTTGDHKARSEVARDTTPQQQRNSQRKRRRGWPMPSTNHGHPTGTTPPPPLQRHPRSNAPHHQPGGARPVTPGAVEGGNPLQTTPHHHSRPIPTSDHADDRTATSSSEGPHKNIPSTESEDEAWGHARRRRTAETDNT